MRYPYAPIRFIRTAIFGLALLCPSISYAQDYTSNIIGYWNFDETSGSTFTDQTGSNDGTWTDNADNDFSGESVTGYFGNGILLDGVDDRINFGSDSSIDSIVPLTVCMWVNPITFGSGYKNLITKTNNGGSDGWDFYTGSGIVGLSTWNGGYKQPGGLTTGSWQHICVTWDGSAGAGGIDNYLDGTHLPNAGAGWGSSSGDDANALVLGQRTGGSLGLNGSFDELRIYNRKLTNADIAALYAYTITDYTCSNPDGVTGEMLFNSDARALQYCNASSWVGIGPADSSEQGLVGHWTLDETSGTTAADSSASSNNGTMTSMDGASDTVTGQIGTALSFAGGSRITAGAAATNVDDIFAGGGTISYWIYPTNWNTFGRVFDKSDAGGYPPDSGWHQQGTANRVILSQAFSGGTAQWETAVGSVPLNTWSYISITYDNSDANNDPTFYINGTAVALSADTNATGTAVSDAANPITIGSRQGGSNNYTGHIDDVRMYNRTLSSSEIAGLYSTAPTCSATTTSLAGHWTLNETSGSSIADSSGNGNTGTWNDGTGNDVTEETIAGQDGTAIDFDGADDRISIGSAASIENVFNGGGALSMWIYPESWGGCSYGRILEKAANITGAGGWSIIVNNGGGVNPKENVAFYKGHSTTYSRWTTPFQSITLNAWNHITVSYSDDDLNNHPTIYINGTAQSLTQNNPPVGTPDSDVGNTMRIGYGGGCGFDGIIDDVRVYDGSLSSTEVSEIYGATGGTCSVSTCAAPSGTTGEIVFNTDYDVMQYCNGNNWIAMGPPGDGGAGCTNPTGLAAELRYNTDLNVVQYCEGDEWVAVIGINNASIPTSGLVGYWTLDETSGSAIADSSGNSNDGTWSDGVNNDITEETVAGKVNTAPAFDGSDTAVSLGSPAALDNIFNGGGTIAMWFNANSTGEAGYGRLFEKATGAGAANGYSLTIMSAPSITFWREFSGGDGTWGNIPITWGDWYHIAVVYDDSNASNNPVIYLNGMAISTSNSNSSGTAASDAASNLVIGNSDASSRTFDGIIDDTRIYDRALSSAEILSIYNATK